MSGHTPGPWQIEGQARGGLLISAGLNEYRDGPAAYVGILKADFPRKLNPADTTLIVAAPELMAALVKAEAFIAGFEGDDLQEGMDDLLRAVRSAIAKAGGQ
jgi:hypothetical protein